ncbi:MAG: peptide ABC transporter substrate-binding protein [Lachnospiraceae bacterium]|nr:peptide ABC transporter substrate-binding protein [Lachnospiraceae bacterium]
MRRFTALTMAAALMITAVPVVVMADEAEVKSVRIGAPYDPVTMDYAELNADPATWMDIMVGETLIRNKQGTYIGGLAESWEKSEDGMTWTFKLKEGLTYSDGETPVTAEDLEYAAKRLMDPNAGHYQAEAGYSLLNGEQYYAGECEWEEVGINVIDDLTIEYTFKNPAYESDFTSTTLFSALEEAFVEPLGTEYGSAPEKILTDGPFTVAEWYSDSSVKLVKNENYWDAESIMMDEINIIIGATGDTGLDMMLADELDFVPSGSDTQNQILADEGCVNFTFTTSYQCMNLNHKGKTEESGLFLGNTNFRKALTYAIDREALSASVITSVAPANRLTAPTEAGVNGFFNDEYPYEAWPTKADPEKAQEYLNLALEELGKTKEDIPVIDLLCYESQGAIDTLAAIQDMLKTNLGIESQINPQTIQVMISSAMSGDYDLWYGGNSMGVPDALGGFLSGYTTAMQTALRGYSNEEYDALYDAAVASPTLEERKANYFEVEKFFCDNVLIILLGWSEGGYNHKPGYSGYWYDVDIDFTYLDYAAE